MARLQMTRKLVADTLLIASHNLGKVLEINELVAHYGVSALSAAALGLPVPEETENTFEGNAAIKALAAARASGLPALADDSGLEVAALDGAPGVWSADWAEAPGVEGRDFSRGIARIEKAVRECGSTDLSAQFVCALCLAWPDGHTETFIGSVRGAIAFPPRGDRGFGYDPIFVPEGRSHTFGEMDPAEKHAMSHRADAFRKLVAACLEA